jgi:HSP20 family protein
MVIRMRDPFATLLAMQNALDKAMQNDWLGNRTSGRGVYPPVNVFRQGDEYVVVAELPGVRKSDLDVTIKGDEVRIVGNKQIDYDEESSVHRRERASGQFDRTLNFPSQIDSGKCKAEFRDGLLALQLPVAESEKARSISIR